ncbi:putative transporter [Lachnellula hyalina]|uniref:Putative transporter n=1 Tax=Lachnellula hyalina TaxID=1316788 RepID=A0A8H8R5N5_9HELO|nr:putative transporter [Lachnellula hyalina]TVY27304.1 putative transporter [Lachnellula hyalina]
MEAPRKPETTPLLNEFPSRDLERPTSNNRQNGYNAIIDRGLRHLKSTFGEPATIWSVEAKLLAKSALPLILTYMLQYSYYLITIYIAGKLGTKEQAGASLAIMVAKITGISIYEGLATSLDTLTSQAYGGGRKELVGLHLQRMSALMIVATIPIGAIWISSPWILQRLVPEPELAELAGLYLRYYLIGAPGYGLFEAGKRFTQAQGNFTASLVVMILCAPLNVFWSWLFVFRFDAGLKGAALATALSNNLQPLILLVYVNTFARDLLECWPGLLLKGAFWNWGDMLRLSIPGVSMILSEWLAFEILAFLSSYISTAALAAQSVLISVTIIMYHIPYPVAIAASTRFGNLIGRGAVAPARELWIIYYTIFVGIGIFNTVLLLSLRHVIADNFTSDSDVRKLILATIPLVAAAELFDTMSAIANGLLRGLGRQRIGGIINFGVYYGWAVPLSLLLTFGPLNLGLAGLWVGPLTGLGLVTVIISIYLKFSDWQNAIDDAKACQI